MDAATAKRPVEVRRTKYDERREEVIDAAAAMFAARGYHGANTTEIADRVGIRQGSVYYYFSSKEAALEEVCAKGVTDFIEGLTEIVSRDAPIKDRLRAAVVNHLKPIVDRPDYVRTFINQRQFLPDQSRKRIGRQVRQYERLMCELFRSGVADGRFVPNLNCELTALRLIAECNGVFAWFGRRADELSIQAVAAEIADGFLTGVLIRT